MWIGAGQLTAAAEQAEKAEQLAESRRRATDQAVREKEELISAHRKETADLRAALEAAKAELDAANTTRVTDVRPARCHDGTWSLGRG